MNLVYMIGIIIITISAVMLLVCWLSHLYLTNSNSLKSGWGGYRTFKKWFNNYSWIGDLRNKGCLWTDDLKCEYHAGIIKFERVGMKINNPISYLLVILYVWRYCSSLESNHRFNFKKASPEKKAKKEGYLVELPDGSKTFVTVAEIYGRAID